MPILDHGLQPERMSLAWRCTALSLAVGSLVASRLLPILLGSPVWALVGVAGIVFSGAVWLSGEQRATRWTAQLLLKALVHGSGDGALLFVAAVSAFLAVIAIAVIIAASPF